MEREDDLSDVDADTAPVIPVSFDPEDHTTEVPRPVKHIFLAPSTMRLETMRLAYMLHPRHRRPVRFAAAQADEGRALLYEVQEVQQKFQTWFIDNTVEPKSPLYLCSQMSVEFHALAFAHEQLRERFASVDEVLGHSEVPQWLREELCAACRLFCDTKEIQCSADAKPQTFCRFSETRTVAWFQAKVYSLTSHPALRQLIANNRQDTAAPNAETLLQLRQAAGGIVAEYVPTELHEMMMKSIGCQAGLAPKCLVVQSHRDTTVAEKEDEPVVKKMRAEACSASVKRLAKAGAPKGTPSILSFFGKPKPPTS